MKTRTERSTPAAPPMQPIAILLPGLDCVSCANRLRIHLETIQGLEFDLSLASRSVSLAPGSQTDAIRQAVRVIRDNGFDPRAARVLIPLFDLRVGSAAIRDIESSLESLDGVLRAIVHVAEQAVEVWYVPGKTGIAEIRQRIRMTGHRNEAPAGSTEIDDRLERMHRRTRLEAAAAVTAAIVITFLSLPLAAGRAPTVAEPVTSFLTGVVRAIAPQLYEVDSVTLEIAILFVTFGFLVWLGRSWMESGSFTLVGRNPDSNTTAAAAVFVLAAGLTVSSILVAWKEAPSYAFPGYATLFGMISLYSLTRLLESRELRRIRAGDAAFRVRSVARDTEMQQRGETTMSLALRIIICVAIASFVLWFDFAPESPLLFAIVAFTGIMIATQPALFGLAVPAALSAGMREAARRGVVVRDALAFEDLGRLKKLAILKEGILTEGRPVTSDFVLLGGIGQRELLQIAASLAQHAESQLARALVARAGGIETQDVIDFHEFPDQGFRGNVGGRAVVAGTPGLIESLGIPTAVLADELARYGSEGKSSLVLVIDRGVAGMIALRDELLEDASKAVTRLGSLGVTVHLFGSDERTPLEAIASRTGINDVTAEIEPSFLRGAMADAKEPGKPLAVLCPENGDALLLTAADLPVAAAGAPGRAVDYARVVVPAGGLGAVADAIVISRASSDAAARSIRWSAGYHAVVTLFATQILYPAFGTLISPALFALVMFSALVTAIWNNRRFERRAGAL